MITDLNFNTIEQEVQKTAQYDTEIICEEFVEKFREFQISIIQSGTNFIVSNPLEIISNSDFLNYEEKFSSNSSIRYLPLLDKDNQLALTMRDIALKIFQELPLRHFLRVDFLFSPTSNTLYVNEISPMFGMAKESAFWKLWRNTHQDDEMTLKLILNNFV